jgi:hypothetical protein
VIKEAIVLFEARMMQLLSRQMLAENNVAVSGNYLLQ